MLVAMLAAEEFGLATNVGKKRGGHLRVCAWRCVAGLSAGG